MKKNVIILTAPKKGKLFSGEINFYEQLLSSISEQGGMGYVLPLSEGNKVFKGYLWNHPKKQWQEAICPKPHYVYNRYPHREKEGFAPFSSYIKHLIRWDIPFFNASFFNKKTIASLLQEEKYIKGNFPKTLPLTDRNNLFKFLQKHRSVYLKDVHGSQGKGIWKITRDQKTYTLFSQQRTFSRMSFPRLAFLLDAIMKERTLLLQETIPVVKVNEVPYDFRVLMIFHNHKWKLVGVGVRAASHGGYTTHVPQGGTTISIRDVPVRPTAPRVQRLGEKIGDLLRHHYTNVREFSFDVLMDTNGKMWVVDVNSKPMSFDETNIQGQRIQLLTDILLDKVTIGAR